MTAEEEAKLAGLIRFLMHHVKELETAFNKSNKQIQLNEAELTHAIIELRGMILPVLRERAVHNDVALNRVINIMEVENQKYLM